MDGEFTNAANEASRRLFLIRWLSALRATAVPAGLIALLAVAAVRLGGLQIWEQWWVPVLLVAWIAACGFRAAVTRPRGFAALAAWDEAGGRKETMASAQFFETHESDGPGESLHLTRAHRKLEAARRKMNRELPLPRMGGGWIVPVLAVAFALSPLMRPEVSAVDIPVDDAVAEQAKKEAKNLEKQLDKMNELSGLSNDEKKELDEVVRKARESIQKQLNKSEGKSTREILEELEKRARAAEKLAKEMGEAADDKWASDQLIAEMMKHADLADLAEGIKAKKAEPSAKEARKISKRLKSDDLTREAESRVTRAVDQSGKKATDDDLKKPVGEHVERAGRRLADKKKNEGADEFEKLADKLHRIAQRENAKKQMQKLASQLRRAGSKLTGNKSGGLKRLAKNNQKPNPLNNRLQKALQNNPNLQGLPNMPMNNNPLNMPGLQNLPILNPQNIKFQKGMGMPKPGGMCPVPGTLPKNIKNLTIVPGMGAGGKPKAIIPIPGMGAGGMGAGQGGLQAGHGSAGMGNNKTDPFAATGGAVVAAQIGDTGEIAVRAIEGGPTQESASRIATEKMAEFVKVQEEALELENLPTSRREHVKQYFNLLRERFEDAEG